VALPNLGVDLNFLGLAYRWIYRRPEKTTRKPKKPPHRFAPSGSQFSSKMSAPARMAGYFGTAEAA